MHGNGSQKVDTPLQMHQAGGPDKLPVEIYSKDETTVQVTIHAGDLEKATPLGCEGSVTKTIVVHDDPKLPKVVK